MNRLLRTAYSTTLAYLFIAIIPALAAGTGMPFPAFVCLYFGVLVFLLPHAAPKLAGKEALFKLLGVLLALIGFVPILLYRRPLVHFIAYGAAVLFAGLFTETLKHRTTHDDFAAKFRFSVFLILGVIAAMYLSQIIGIAEEFVVPISRANIKQAVEHTVPIAIMLLVTGVLLLRGLRALDGTVNERDFNRRQLRDAFVYAALVSFFFMINPFFYKGLAWVMNKLVVAGFDRLAQAFGKLLDLIAGLGPKLNEQPLVVASPEPAPEGGLPPAPLATPVPVTDYKIDDAGEKYLYKTLLYIFIGIAAAVLLTILVIELVKLIKKLRKKGGSRGRGYPNEIREALDDDDAGKKADKPKKRGEPRTRIRYYYREFLRILRRVPVLVHPSDTCGEINENAKTALRVDEEELSEFREIYEHARYSTEPAPTEQDAARMKTLYEGLKNRRS